MWNNCALNVYGAVSITCYDYRGVKQRLIWPVPWFRCLVAGLSRRRPELSPRADRDSVLGIATRYGLDGPGIESR
jgi:hypothetical protein